MDIEDLVEVEAPVKILGQLHNMIKSSASAFKSYITATMGNLKN